MEPLLYFLVLFQSFVTAMVLTPIAKRLAPGLGFLDQPDPRKVHQHPTPLLGGASIYFAFVLTIVGNLAGVWMLRSFADIEGGFLARLIAQGSAYIPGILGRTGELAGV